MSIQGVPITESAGKFLKFTFHLIKSIAVTQTRTCYFSRFSHRLCQSVVLNFFLVLAMHCNIVILCWLHRYSKYWCPCSQSGCRYFGSYVSLYIESSFFCIYIYMTECYVLCLSYLSVLLVCSLTMFYFHSVFCKVFWISKGKFWNFVFQKFSH